MRIITWNCKMAYRKKDKFISEFRPDLVVVPECESFEKTKRNLWFGDNPKKGIGIFSYSDFELQLHESYNPSFRYVIPIRVKGTVEFNLFAVWAMDDTYNVRQRYIGQVFSALKYYEKLLGDPTIIVGDFNWNAIWDDSPDNSLYGNLSDVVEFLKSKKIQSAYHEFYKEDFGRETKPTFFMYHKLDKPYHIDYCFASSDSSVQQVDVGNFNSWIKKSDHMPLVVTLEYDK